MRTPARLWPGSLRLQLTVVFGLIFFIAAAAVLVVTTILVDNSLHYGLDLAFSQSLKSDSQLLRNPHLVAHIHASDDATKQVITTSMRRNLMLKGSMTVLAIGVAAAAVGWLIAGRLLRPLQVISSTAGAIAGRNLHRRIALDGRPGEMKTLADSFDRMLDRLDQACAGQERFIANAAHELKTPIAVNRTLVEVAMNRRDAPPEVIRLGETS